MKNLNTPGPWKMSIGPNAREIYEPATGHTICRAPVADAFPTVMWADNGPLIASLPQLLAERDALRAACKILVRWADGNNMTGTLSEPPGIDEAREALALGGKGEA